MILKNWKSVSFPLMKHKVIEILSSHIQDFRPTDLYTEDALRL